MPMSQKPFDPKIIRRTTTAQRIACAMASGRQSEAVAEAEMTGSPIHTMAMGVLIMQKQYGLKATEKALKQLAMA
jgi:hypothetical protein